jgi:hypothetical protein
MTVCSTTAASLQTPVAPVAQPAPQQNDHDADDRVSSAPAKSAPAPGTGLVVDKTA